MVRAVKAILFDLDGTLVDTAPDIADALNDTLASLGRPAVAEVQVRAWIGDGGRALLAKALAGSGDVNAAGSGNLDAAGTGVADRAWPTFDAAYEALCGLRSVVHDGVPEMLATLRADGVKLAVLTNKERHFTVKLLGELRLLAAFDAIVAGDTLAVKKPHPDMVHHALALLGVAADEALLVGDSITDVRTARAAGIAVLLVRHGYPAGEFSGADAPDGFIESFVGIGFDGR